MRTTFFAVVIFITIFAGSNIIFAGESVPYTFTSGATASAAQVNANFNFLGERTWSLNAGKIYLNGSNVGIGTSSPSELFEVTGGTFGNDFGISIKQNSYGAGYPGLYFKDESGNRIAAIRSHQDRESLYFTAFTGHYVFQKANLTTAMIIRDSGNVGIGMDAPSYLLSLNGGAYCDGTTWTNASSRNFKENIQDIDSNKAFETLMALKPVSFNYKTNKTEENLGFIAEDVPELVATNDRKGLSSMDFVAILTKVVQEQQKQIEELKSEIKDMQYK